MPSPANQAEALDRLRFEVGHVTDGAGATLDDEAIIFFEGDDDSSDIRIRAPNAIHIATRLVELWNAAARRSA